MAMFSVCQVFPTQVSFCMSTVRWRRPEIRGPEGPFDGAPRGPAGPAAPPAPKNGLTETNSKDLSEVKKVRSEFPETWLWTNAISGYMRMFQVATLYSGALCFAFSNGGTTFIVAS